MLAAPPNGASNGTPINTTTPANGTLSPSLSGSGTTNYLPLWTSSSALGSSVLFQSETGSSAKIGINTTTPAATLDVNGGLTVRGLFNLPPAGTATTSGGVDSRPLGFVAQTFNSGTHATANQAFHWQAEPVGNNTATPSATLNLLFATAPAVSAETGLSINSKGQITFAPGQSFPGTGTGTITGVTAGTDLTGGGTGGSVTLNVDTTKVPQLKSNNVFTGTQQFANTGVGTVPASNTYTPLSVGSANGFGTWFAIANTSTGGHTWNIISAGAGNAEGAGNFGITDLTGKSTIWLEGNTNTTNLVASGSAGAAIVDADVQGANKATSTPGLRFGGGSSGETIASNRNLGTNRYGLDFYTEFAPRVSITQSGQMGIGTQVPHNQLDVISKSIGYAAIFADGASSASGSGAGGGIGLEADGGDADPGSNSVPGGDGVLAYGGNATGTSNGWAGSGGVFTGGSGSGASLSGGDGILAYAGSDTSDFGPFAGAFLGDIYVNGGVSNNAMTSVIDHPLDPENKVLRHSAVESPDMMNIYNGIAALDANGEAAISMPDWFSAINRDFRYQLTAIGAPGPNLYIAEELTNNQFKIGGGRAGMKVSWQITGIRQDAWANSHRIVVEEEKPDSERGFYLHPELYGQPAEKQVEWARHPGMMRRLNALRERKAKVAVNQ